MSRIHTRAISSSTLRLHSSGQIKTLSKSQTVCYHSLIYTGCHKLQGITLLNMPFLLCAFPFQTLTSPAGSDWATRFTLSAQKAHQHLRQPYINTAILLFQLNLPSSLSKLSSKKSLGSRGHIHPNKLLSHGLFPSWCWSQLGIHTNSLGKKVSQTASWAN